MKDVGAGIDTLLDNSTQKAGDNLLRGTHAIVSSTISGAFRTIGNITGSLSGSVSLLTLDDEYLAKRNKRRKRQPKNFLEG